ncbi:MAG: hypothetical protein ACRDRH_13565 [Pseudonocardia sp.]
MSIGYTGTDMTRPPSAVRISTRDGPWAEITIDPEPGQPTTESARGVTEGGPRALWRMMEDAHQLWEDLGQPNWARFGLTATPDRQTVWLDDPVTGTRWDLPATECTAEPR